MCMRVARFAGVAPLLPLLYRCCTTRGCFWNSERSVVWDRPSLCSGWHAHIIRIHAHTEASVVCCYETKTFETVFQVPTAVGSCMALRSADGFRRLLRSLTRNNLEQNVNAADRKVHDFRCELTACKCQELHAPG